MSMGTFVYFITKLLYMSALMKEFEMKRSQKHSSRRSTEQFDLHRGNQ